MDYLNGFEIVPDDGDDDTACWDAFGRLDFADDTRFGVFDDGIFYIFILLLVIAADSTVKRHLEISAMWAIGCAGPTEGMRGIAVGNVARNCWINDGLDKATCVHIFSFDGQLGTSRARTPDRMDGFNDWIDELIAVDRFVFNPGDSDDDGSTARFFYSRAFNETNDPLRWDIKFLVGMTWRASDRDSSNIRKLCTQIGSFDGHVGTTFQRAELRVETCDLSYREMCYHVPVSAFATKFQKRI